MARPILGIAAGSMVNVLMIPHHVLLEISAAVAPLLGRLVAGPVPRPIAAPRAGEQGP